MSNIRKQGESVRRYILENVASHSSNISKITAVKFGISRQAVNKHLQRLVDEGALVPRGKTRRRIYQLASLTTWKQKYSLQSQLGEDHIWRKDVVPQLGKLPENVRDIWQYSFTEMFNNAIDHSEGQYIDVSIERTASTTQIIISDDGVGIFKKIQDHLNLLDERHSVLELAKGKLTTDPRRHSGEGIFFTSRMFDDFAIMAGGIYFSHEFEKSEDWILEREQATFGTTVYMRLYNHTARTTKAVFDKFSSGDGYGFNKTVVPVKLAKYGDDNLISRSRAKRLLIRVDRFKTVVLDFSDVQAIGQAFADEIFRVFAQEHPDIQLHPIHVNSSVKRMITRAKNA